MNKVSSRLVQSLAYAGKMDETGETQETLVDAGISHAFRMKGKLILFLKRSWKWRCIMRFSRSTFRRCFNLAAIVLVCSFAFTGISCKTNDDDDTLRNAILYQQAAKQARVGRPTALQASDAVCGSWAGSGLSFDIAEKFYGNDSVSNCEKVDSENDTTKTYTDYYGNKVILDKSKANEVYVVYNDINMKSGVLLFKARYSAWGSPAVGCFYGVKFELKEGNKALFEGGYNSNLNNISDLNEACEKLAFGNNDYYSPSSWTEKYSGVEKK